MGNATRRPMSPTNDMVEQLRGRLLNVVRQEGRDLSIRQLLVLLICCSVDEPQTVRWLAQHLDIPQPVITRVANRLEEAGLVRRLVDPEDRRSILVASTPAGLHYCAKFFGDAVGRADEDL
jgi:DNA-binding MarR family transcriptional regulator